MLPLYRNQTVDLQNKSTDWFLYDGNIGRLTWALLMSLEKMSESLSYFQKTFMFGSTCLFKTIISNGLFSNGFMF